MKVHCCSMSELERSRPLLGPLIALGVVKADGIKKLIKKAEELGADAVVNYHMTSDAIGWVQNYGEAVRYKRDMPGRKGAKKVKKVVDNDYDRENILRR